MVKIQRAILYKNTNITCGTLNIIHLEKEVKFIGKEIRTIKYDAGLKIEAYLLQGIIQNSLITFMTIMYWDLLKKANDIYHVITGNIL